jgi:hypothetical protein
MTKSAVCVIAAIVGSSAALAGTDTYTDEATFLANVQGGAYTEDFSGVAPGPVDTLNFSGGGFSYTASSTVGMDVGSTGDGGLFNDPGLLSLNTATDALLITFTGAPVTAVGGEFFASDISFFEIPADVTVNLGDGSSIAFTGGGFAGFTSNVAITSLIIDASDATLGAPAWPTVDSLIVGQVVPAPAGLAVLGAGALIAFRRRR